MTRRFVLMSFDDNRREVYDYSIHPAAAAAGYDCHRADEIFRSEAIISNIVKSIFKDDVIVADLSGFNPNVLYELGVAHAIGDKTIMICERTGLKIPFNLNMYRVIFYDKNVEGLQKKLRTELEQALRDFPNWGPEPTNPVQDFRPIKYALPLQEQARLESQIEELNEVIVNLEREKSRGELRTLLFTLPELLLGHLKGLISPTPFHYIKRREFVEELRKLRGLGLVKTKPGVSIGDIPETGDLKDYLEVTELAKQVLKELLRLAKL